MQPVSKTGASLQSFLHEQDNDHGCKRKTEQVSGDSSEEKFPEHAILHRHKGDWRAGEGRGEELLLYGLILLFLKD